MFSSLPLFVESFSSNDCTVSATFQCDSQTSGVHFAMLRSSVRFKVFIPCNIWGACVARLFRLLLSCRYLLWLVCHHILMSTTNSSDGYFSLSRIWTICMPVCPCMSCVMSCPCWLGLSLWVFSSLFGFPQSTSVLALLFHLQSPTLCLCMRCSPVCQRILILPAPDWASCRILHCS